MKYDIVLAGVGGQGVISIAAIIASSAMKEGLHVKQAEVHGMSQRGGAVQSNLRLSDGEIHSDMVPKGTADLLISMEPLESLRYLDYLSKEGTLFTASDPFLNIPNYPDLDGVLTKVRSLPRAVTVDAKKLASEAGSSRATNMVMVGAASHFLPIKPETLQGWIESMFKRKGEKVVEANLKAFALGREIRTPM
ncbi:MAG: indolepyruvate oxidoreductase subunit beta [Deltaproteobacteria bacterium]|nr:indolepyruvate oxidoreductase subunit beta [Deltaproteobacteria bacterium]